MTHFMCDIIGGNNRVIKERFWVTDVSDDTRFSDVYSEHSPDNFKDSPVKACIGLKKPEHEPGNWCNVSLAQSISLISVQGGNYVRFIIVDKPGIYHLIGFLLKTFVY